MFPRALILLVAGAAAWQTPCPAQSADLPPEIAAHVPKNLRSYFVGFVVTPSIPRRMTNEIFVRHQAYIRKQIEAGVYHLVGPLTDGGRVRGLTILSASSIEDARAIVEADPAVQEHILDVEIHPAMLPSLASLKIEYPPRR